MSLCTLNHALLISNTVSVHIYCLKRLIICQSFAIIYIHEAIIYLHFVILLIFRWYDKEDLDIVRYRYS